MFEDFLPIFYPENRPKTARKTGLKPPKILPEAFPEKLEIANKPVRENLRRDPSYDKKATTTNM